MRFSLASVFDDLPRIQIVDIGASLVDGPPPYQQLFDIGAARVIGFEPSPEEYQKLQEQCKPYENYLPYAIGDGRDTVLNICYSPGFTSLYEPDLEILEHFHGLAEFARVIRRQPISTRRLDDVDEVKTIDYLKLDVQGSELSVLQGATEKLSKTLIVHTEVQFVPFYKEQPLFAEVDQELRKAGFYIHRFAPLQSRAFKPLLANKSIHLGFGQILWSDVVYVRKFTDFPRLPSESLLKIAFVLHDLYDSFDLAALALGHIDKREETNRKSVYLRRLISQQ